MTVVLLYTGIDDLVDVKGVLKNLVDWLSLGLELGLLYPTLKKIEKDQHEKTDRCVMEMIAAWLQQQDNVSKKGVPSWTVLQTALQKIGEIQLANEIDQNQGLIEPSGKRRRTLCPLAASRLDKPLSKPIIMVSQTIECVACAYHALFLIQED